MQKLKTGICFLLAVCWALGICAQLPVIKTSRQLTVADGLPQSFVSGIVQDSVGFMWIATRDGLARYDGRKFKLFLHKQGDAASPANNIISDLFLDNENGLWILYETGDIDLLNTISEELMHISAAHSFKQLKGMVKKGHSMAEDSRGNIWMLANKGGLFICNFRQKRMQYYSDTVLCLENDKIVGIASSKGLIHLLTDESLLIVNENMEVLQRLPYLFDHTHLYDSTAQWKDVYAFFRQNGEIVIQDDIRLLVYNPVSRKVKPVILPGEKNMQRVSSAMDRNGQVFIACNNNIYLLTLQNELALWKANATSPVFGFKSVFIDRSGVLWLGGNGIGLQLYNLHPPGFSSAAYVVNFHEDVLHQYLHIPMQQIIHSSLNSANSYFFRWLYANNKIWFTIASGIKELAPVVSCYSNGKIIHKNWHYAPDNLKEHSSISALAVSSSGKLWGIDFLLQPVYFDTGTLTATAYAPVATVNTDNNYTANSLLVDGENRFWISTAFDGLFFYDRERQTTIHYRAGENAAALPTNQLMNMVQDPSDSGIIWIGSIGGGLIRFNKTTGKCHTYSMQDGLPNNTVYAVMIDEKGLLWCSSNKGIFSFDRLTGRVRSFTTEDGLPCDEFNRYHYFKLPDGRLAFGGIEGYTVFNPLKLAEDVFQPHVALTGISINNVPLDYGMAGSPFKRSINSMDTLVLDYGQNFISFNMAALQYNVPQRLQYRYMLQGYDKDWVNTDNNNIITYTKLPPGSYTLKANASNTAGQWSPYTKSLAILIQPPFWKTTWFIALVAIAGAVLVYLLIQFRVRLVRKEEQQKAWFESQAAELKAQALTAQMNPHFIFNCLNSIKSLIQEDNKRHAVIYLTTFSKLIRNRLNNVQQEISMHAELETCRLYTQLESLRFGENIVCRFDIQQGMDLHSVHVPPLIIQPFIENAIWHGILPKGGGEVVVSVKEEKSNIICTIDDNGIGREVALYNKSHTYEPKGMNLVMNRLDLHNNICSESNCTAEVIDKKDAGDNPAGTLVIIKFQKKL